ncbi:MAG TPA: septum formation initiator family protein [Terracidiphilus sp.]
MTDETVEVEKTEAKTVGVPLSKRAVAFTLRMWRPAGTGVIVCLALLLMGHVVNGKNGLTVWHQKRAEDQQLQKEIDKLQQENTQLQQHVDELKSDPDAIEHEAREKLHYAKPNEVIVALPPQPSGQGQTADPGK